MRVGVAKETFPGENRVALTPQSVPALKKLGLDVVVQSSAGLAAGFSDSQYVEKGATIESERARVYECELVLQVRAAGENPVEGAADLPLMRSGQSLIAACDALASAPQVEPIARTGVGLFALELIPRITRAQSMDILSSQAMLAGYRAVLLGAIELQKIFPMMMTAAGTLTASKVFVLGAGVAGLQAIATARKLGAIVYAYDLRPATREQVESLGGKFVTLDIASESSEDKGGYAKAMDEAFYQKQREELAKTVAQCDVVITTAAIPGKRSPILVTAAAVRSMQPGSVVVDLAAQRGGNCELTQADRRVVDSGVVILGPTNIVSDAATHASVMFSNNVTKFLQNLIVDGKVKLRMDDEIIRDTLVAYEGRIVHPRLQSVPA